MIIAARTTREKHHLLENLLCEKKNSHKKTPITINLSIDQQTKEEELSNAQCPTQTHNIFDDLTNAFNYGVTIYVQEGISDH